MYLDGAIDGMAVKFCKKTYDTSSPVMVCAWGLNQSFMAFGNSGMYIEKERKKERKKNLNGLVVRVSGYRCRGPGFDPRRYQIF